MQGTCQCNIAAQRGSCRRAEYTGFAGLAAEFAVDRNFAAISAFAAKMEPFAVKRQGPFLLLPVANVWCSMYFAHGQSWRADFVSSLRKGCRWEVDTCTTSRR